MVGYLCAWCQPPHQLMATSTRCWQRARAALSEPPATVSTRSRIPDISGQSNPAGHQISANGQTLPDRSDISGQSNPVRNQTSADSQTLRRNQISADKQTLPETRCQRTVRPCQKTDIRTIMSGKVSQLLMLQLMNTGQRQS